MMATATAAAAAAAAVVAAAATKNGILFGPHDGPIPETPEHSCVFLLFRKLVESPSSRILSESH
jgi:hypothetical protein